MASMKTITPGHEYQLASFEGGEPQTIRFINKTNLAREKYIREETHCGRLAGLSEEAARATAVKAADKIQSSVGFDAELITVHDGTTNEEVLAMLIDRMNYLQKLCPCRENAIVITKLEESLMWLNKRTAERKARNVEGTSHA